MRTLLLLSLALLLMGNAAAADPEQAKFSKSAERATNAKRKKIQAEIARLRSHEWAGEYFAGDGLGMNTSLVIAPKAGYVFEWHGCLGLYDRNYGNVTNTNERIRLTFTFENQRKGLEGIAPELIVISWESRRYLVATDDVVKFCNSVNGGREPRNQIHGSYLLRQGDEEKAVTGFPKVPEKYEDYLLAKPIDATIVAVGSYTTRPMIDESRFKDTPVTLDVGTRQGLRVGMELAVTEPPHVWESVRVTKVDETRSEAIMTQIGEEEPGPRAGWRLSTRTR